MSGPIVFFDGTGLFMFLDLAGAIVLNVVATNDAVLFATLVDLTVDEYPGSFLLNQIAAFYQRKQIVSRFVINPGVVWICIDGKIDL